MSGSQAPVTEDEILEVMAREMPADLRLEARMPGKGGLFHDLEQVWAYMLEEGLISEDVYQWGLNNRFSFKLHLPAHASRDFIKAVNEAKKPLGLLTMVSQAAGAKRLGDNVVPILRSQVPGMDAREILEIIREPLVAEQLTLQEELEILEIVQAKMEKEGAQDDEETAEALETIRKFREIRKSLGLEVSK